MLSTKLLHCQQYIITYSTVTSQNSQLTNVFNVMRNLAICELFPCIYCGVYGVMPDCLSLGCLADLPWCGRSCSISCDRCQPSLWFSRVFVSRTPCCSSILFLLPIIARRPLILCLGFALYFCHPTDCSVNFLVGYGTALSCVVRVGSHDFGSRDAS